MSKDGNWQWTAMIGASGSVIDGVTYWYQCRVNEESPYSQGHCDWRFVRFFFIIHEYYGFEERQENCKVLALSEYLGATWQTHKTDYTSYYI